MGAPNCFGAPHVLERWYKGNFAGKLPFLQFWSAGSSVLEGGPKWAALQNKGNSTCVLPLFLSSLGLLLGSQVQESTVLYLVDTVL